MTKEQRSKIHELAVEQITEDYKFIVQTVQANGEHIYGFAIGMVSQLAGFFSVGNTLEALKEKFKNEEFDPWYIWGISEWKYEGNSNNKLANYLGSYSEDISDEDYNRELKEYEQILIKALQTCEQNGLFGKGLEREKLIVFLQYADAYDEDIDDEVAKLINSKENYLLFKNRWEDDRASLTKIIMDKL